MNKLIETFGSSVLPEGAQPDALLKMSQVSSRKRQNLSLSAFVREAEYELERTLREMKDLRDAFMKEFPPYIGYLGYTLTLRRERTDGIRGIFWERYHHKRLPAVLDDPYAYIGDTTQAEARKGGFQETMPVVIENSDEQKALRGGAGKARRTRKNSIMLWSGQRFKTLPPFFYSPKNRISEKTRERFRAYDTEVRRLNGKREKLSRILQKIKEQRQSYLRSKILW